MFGWKKPHTDAVFIAAPGAEKLRSIDATIDALRALRLDLEHLYGELDLACEGIDLLEARLARSQTPHRRRADGVTGAPREFTLTDRQRSS